MRRLTSAPPLSRKAESEFSLLQLLKPEVLADPYPLYRRLREYETVHWDPFLHSWVVTGYADCVTVLAKMNAARTPTPERLEAMGLGILSPYARMMLRQILFMDAPDHTRIRFICAVAFTPGRIAHLRQSIQQIADSLIDRVAPNGQIELLSDFAAQLPALVLCAMLGLPESDHPQLRIWASDFGELLGNFEHDPDRLPELTRSLGSLRDYIEAAVTEQTGSPRDGLISAWIQAEVGGSRLSFDEIVANTILMIAGGLEEITNLIANGMLSLLRHPGQFALLAAHPEIIQSAVEEILRYESTTQYTGRVAPHDIVLGGKQIRQGDAVTAVLAAANRDPERFADPEQLELTRTENRHLAFSWASHYCLGAPLARMTGAIAFSSLLGRLPGLTLVTDRPRWRGMAATRGLRELHLQFQPSGTALPQV